MLSTRFNRGLSNGGDVARGLGVPSASVTNGAKLLEGEVATDVSMDRNPEADKREKPPGEFLTLRVGLGSCFALATK